MMVMKDYLNKYKDKVFLVTGGAGAIGSNLCATLSDAGARLVIILDDLSSGYTWNIPKKKNIMFIKGSITDDIMLKRVFLEKPQYVFHLAAFFANQNSVDYPENDLYTNGLGTLKLLEYSLLSGNIERFVFASTGAIPIKEGAVSLEVSTPYQATKIFGELYCNYFRNNYGLNVVKTRFFSSYGPGEVPGQYRNVIPNFVYWAMKGETLPITGTGEETRSFTYVEDIVDGILRAGYFKEAIGRDFNIASGKEIKIIDLANMINELIGNKARVQFVQKRKWDTKKRCSVYTEKAKGILGFDPKTEIVAGLFNTIQWFKQNWENIEKSASFGYGMSGGGER
jgi:UDP-glucose 4-epimerase